MKPINRRLLIKKIEHKPEEQQSTFLLPENYKTKTEERYVAVKILDVSEDSDKFHEHHKGKTCIVESGMIEEIRHAQNTYNIIGENYVVLLSGD
mgnify:CR=1 FL=1